MPDPDSNEARIQRHRDACRTVPAEVSDAIRREAARQREVLFAATQELTEALGFIDRVCQAPEQEVSYETMQRSGFRRPDGWRRRYTLADARRHASTAAKRLRVAWELLDPTSEQRQEEALLVAKATPIFAANS